MLHACLPEGQGDASNIRRRLDMLRQAMKPKMVSCDALIIACEKGNELRQEVDVCADMLQQAVKPNMATSWTCNASANSPMSMLTAPRINLVGLLF